MRILLVAAALVWVGAYLITNSGRSAHEVTRFATIPDYPAKSPEDWFVSVKADLKAARIAASQGNTDVLEAVSRSAIAYRGQIPQWTRTPPSSHAYSACGDLVIAMADLAKYPASALSKALGLQDSCWDAIIFSPKKQR